MEGPRHGVHRREGTWHHGCRATVDKHGLSRRHTTTTTHTTRHRHDHGLSSSKVATTATANDHMLTGVGLLVDDGDGHDGIVGDASLERTSDTLGNL